MNDNARKWVEVLRSGEFKQARRHLRDVVDDETGELGHCCLGVACEVYLRETGDGGWTLPKTFTVDGFSSSIELPPAVAAWLGLERRDGRFYKPVRRGEGCDWLTGRNDSGASFADIATLIESEPKGLFGELA